MTKELLIIGQDIEILKSKIMLECKKTFIMNIVLKVFIFFGWIK